MRLRTVFVRGCSPVAHGVGLMNSTRHLRATQGTAFIVEAWVCSVAVTVQPGALMSCLLAYADRPQRCLHSVGNLLAEAPLAPTDY